MAPTFSKCITYYAYKICLEVIITKLILMHT